MGIDNEDDRVDVSRVSQRSIEILINVFSSPGKRWWFQWFVGVIVTAIFFLAMLAFAWLFPGARNGNGTGKAGHNNQTWERPLGGEQE